jgi:hypothetical protein
MRSTQRDSGPRATADRVRAAKQASKTASLQSYPTEGTVDVRRVRISDLDGRWLPRVCVVIKGVKAALGVRKLLLPITVIVVIHAP